MGYTHYWRRAEHLDAKALNAAIADVREVLSVMGKMGVKLAGPMGSGPVDLHDSYIAFNGVEHCGHTKRELGITWPSNDAGGVGTSTRGQWFAGALLTERTCGGDCSHETFRIAQTIVPYKGQQPDEKGMYFEFCKTAYKPYDLAVTATLIILKHHLRNALVVSSDGEDKDWRDGAMICQMVLGYGADFKLPTEEE